MTNWATVFWYELAQKSQRKTYLFTTFGIPLIAAIIFGGYVLYTEVIQAGEGSESAGDSQQATAAEDFQNEKPIGYVDLTRFFTPPAAESPFAGLVFAYDTFAQGEAALTADEIEALYVIEKDYFKTGRVTLWMDRLNINALESNLMEGFLVFSLAQETDPTLIARLRLPIVTVTQQRIQPGKAEGEASSVGGDFLLVYVFALALMVSTFTASGYLMQSVVEEKENRTIEIILTSVKPLPLLVGRTLATALLGLFQVVIWMTAAGFLLNAAAVRIVDLGTIEVQPKTIIIGVVYFLLGFGFMGAIFAGFGSVVNSARDGSQLAGWVVFPFVLPLFFISTIAQDPNGTLAVILSIIPFTAPLAMLMREAVTSVPPLELAISLILVIGLATGMMWLAARLFRVSNLLGGETRFRPRLIFSYLFERSGK